jgi:hypothetical protein
MKEFKFKEELTKIDKLGVCCPPKGLINIDQLTSYRFTFAPPNDHKNHIVAGKKNPKRILNTQGEKKCRLFGLSCFKNDEKALFFFDELKKTFPKIKNSLGDSLSEGILLKIDGEVTMEDHWTHFDLFEYEECDLSVRFSPILELP